MTEAAGADEPTFSKTSPEGWVLSERDDGTWEIQKYDEDPKSIFGNDYAAFLHVQSRARGGSAMHALALERDGKPWRKGSGT